MLIELKTYFAKIKSALSYQIWILLAIIAVGVFLRSYNFHAWLDFGSDQVKDIAVVNSVVVDHLPWPAYGPDMSHSGEGGHSQRFLLGPMYYYFEIVAALLFGNYPDKLAYPDLFFSILSLPLFYYFLRKIFAVNLSLALTGLYAISFYALSFSHSAWNVNSIPFFSLLFLTALYEFILAKEDTHWGWIIALGIALGISVQLHAILMVLFPATLFFAWLIFLRKDLKIWKKMLLVILLMLILNLGQIVGESRNGFKNTQIFLGSLLSSSGSGNNIFIKLAIDLNCNIQVNGQFYEYIFSAKGDSVCDPTIIKALKQHLRGKTVVFGDKFYFVKIGLSLALSLIGYGLLGYCFKKETSKQKRQLWDLIILYIALSFLVLLPLEVDLLRYFVHVFFVPFLFLGLAVKCLSEKISSKVWSLGVAFLLFSFFCFLNLTAILKTATVYTAQKRIDLDFIILGELEASLNYMETEAVGQKEINFLCDKRQVLFCRSLEYIVKKRGTRFVKLSREDVIPADSLVFFLGPIPEKNDSDNVKMEKFNILGSEIFGEVGVYKLKVR